MTKLEFVVVAVAVAACGNTTKQGNNKIMLTPDAPIDTAPDAEAAANQVTVNLFATPTLFMYRDGQGAWQMPEAAGLGKFHLHVTNDYETVLVCANGAAFQAVLQGSTFADGATQYLFCDAPGAAGATVDVTGTLAEAGTIAIGGATQTTSSAHASFDLAVTTGAHDLVAYDASNIYVSRGQTISAATALGTVDTDASGTAMVALPLVIGNLGTDKLQTELEWSLTNDYVDLIGSSATLETPPASLVMQDDFQFLDVSANGTGTFRDGSTEFTGSDPGFTLPDAPTGVSFAATSTAVTATWGTLPEYDSLTEFVDAANAPQQQMMTVSQSWVEATGATSLTFDAMPPGYDSAWQVDLASPYFRALSIETISGTSSYDSEVYESVNSTALRRPSRAGRVRAAALRARAQR
ncbi:MAG TPA: hypothetical protein VMJ10_13195 [Kofleriaceae bacterium]|nr:hypothetical protein [Kofleriaceae bacterium]